MNSAVETRTSPPLNLLALRSVGQLVEDVVQHSGQPVCQLRPEEGLVDVLGEVVEHVHGLPGQGQVGPALSLVLRQLAGPTGLLLLALRPPLAGVTHSKPWAQGRDSCSGFARARAASRHARRSCTQGKCNA